MKRIFLLLVSHLSVLAIGFALGIYLLPILTMPEAPADALVAQVADEAAYVGQFRRDLAGSDMLHWGEGTVSVGRKRIALRGRLAPGPDYKLYLAPELVDNEADFLKWRPRMVRVGDVRTFDNFVVDVPDGVDVSQHVAVIVWCETFGQFITAARYREPAAAP